MSAKWFFRISTTHGFQRVASKWSFFTVISVSFSFDSWKCLSIVTSVLATSFCFILFSSTVLTFSVLFRFKRTWISCSTILLVSFLWFLSLSSSFLMSLVTVVVAQMMNDRNEPSSSLSRLDAAVGCVCSTRTSMICSEYFSMISGVCKNAVSVKRSSDGEEMEVPKEMICFHHV